MLLGKDLSLTKLNKKYKNIKIYLNHLTKFQIQSYQHNLIGETLMDMILQAKLETKKDVELAIHLVLLKPLNLE